MPELKSFLIKVIRGGQDIPPMWPVLQVALDLTVLERALAIAEEAVRGGADWIEVGTPLLKSEGMDAVRALKRAFPSRVIVADMKIMDVGDLEVEMAAKSGAGVVTILAAADDSTVKEAVREARKYGVQLMADLINVDDPVRRARELVEIGVDIICVHVGVDQQMRGLTPLEILRVLAGEVDATLAVAGGINSEMAPLAVEAGADIVIVGSAIVKEADVEGAAKRIKEAMLTRKPIRAGHRRIREEEIREALAKVSTCNVSDAMHRKGAIGGFIAVLPEGKKMVGRALTVTTMDGDWAKPVEAVDMAKEGDVIVVDAGDGRTAVWGELATWSCRVKGIAGVVIYGAARDLDEIRRIGVPVFARRFVPNAGEPKGYGEIGSEIVIEGQVVRTGDWILGDESGIVVIPKEEALEIVNRAVDVRDREERLREEIKRGGTLSSVLKLEEWERVG